ncbi:hypothetical protein BS50DRAFT_68576 [Corynespora cassiicola Philippines]|uniref:Uncharacterized protein n=1 Tax=Corynespora cassiicola Philippines TaxID=1448308 RepID=A0A2T2NG85_CORCC|nr:hypothetical protein BS50DRAFT_68576 [Corynespora cassiicola Philippines]
MFARGFSCVTHNVRRAGPGGKHSRPALSLGWFLGCQNPCSCCLGQSQDRDPRSDTPPECDTLKREGITLACSRASKLGSVSAGRFELAPVVELCLVNPAFMPTLPLSAGGSLAVRPKYCIDPPVPVHQTLSPRRHNVEAFPAAVNMSPRALVLLEKVSKNADAFPSSTPLQGSSLKSSAFFTKYTLTTWFLA